MHGWVGRKDRHPVAIDAVVHRDDGSQARVKLSDMTEEGGRMEAEHDFRIGECVEIAVPRLGQLKAQVRWALPGSAGARFVTESSPGRGQLASRRAPS
jgi:hypothetical protein